MQCLLVDSIIICIDFSLWQAIVCFNAGLQLPELRSFIFNLEPILCVYLHAELPMTQANGQIQKQRESLKQ